MIDLENLNDQNFSDIVENCKKKISQFSKDWTNLQESDPGMTLIDLFSWLKVVQHEYMNRAILPAEYKFLELLDIRPCQNRGSETIINLSNAKSDVLIPKGSKFFAGNMEFENDEVESVISSNITGVDFINPDMMYHIGYDEFDSKRIFYVFGNEFDPLKKDGLRIFKINFDSNIPNDAIFSLYFKVFMEQKYNRNPVKASDNFFEMADVIWEFYGEKDSKLGWHEIDVVSDSTHNFLFSGVIKFHMNGKMEPNDGVYSIRARLKNQYYDFPPRITNIFTNVFKVYQKNTLVESNEVKLGDISSTGKFSLSTHLSIYGENIVYIKSDDGFKIINNVKIDKSIKNSKTNFDIGKTIKDLKNLKKDDIAVIVVSYDPSVANLMVLGSGTSISSQQIDTKQREILYDSFNIMVGYPKDNEILYDKWNKVFDFFSSTKFDKCYTLDIESGKIVFGDNEKGQVPKKAKDNIRLSGLALTKGRESNIKSHMINTIMSSNDNIKSLKIDQIENAVLGCDAQTLDDVKSKAASVLNHSKKAVTEEDYEYIVKSTPGLMIQSIKVLPSYNPNKKADSSNCVTIVVRPFGSDDMDLTGYEENIKRYIDKYRLINTKVFVTGPTKIGLSISGEIVVNSYFTSEVDIVANKIRQFINKMNETCGNTLHYGELFGLIDRLDGVSYVESLRITPKGDYLEKTMADDILIPSDGIYYIESLDLNYINSSNI